MDENQREMLLVMVICKLLGKEVEPHEATIAYNECAEKVKEFFRNSN